MADKSDDEGSSRSPERIRGRFAPGHSGNRKGRPKHSKNLRTLILEQLAQKVTITENGKSRTVSKGEAIAMQLVALAARGEPKGIAAVMAFTRDAEQAAVEFATTALSRPEDADVIAGMLERLRAAVDLDGTPSDHAASEDAASNLPADANPLASEEAAGDLRSDAEERSTANNSARKKEGSK